MAMTEKERKLAEMLGGHSIISAVDAMDDEEDGEGRQTTMVPVMFDMSVLEGLDIDQFSKSQMVGLIQRSNSAVELVMKLAASMESPKAIATLNDLIATNRDNILALQKMTKEQRELDVEGRTINIQNNYGTNPQKEEEVQKSKLVDDLEGLEDESQ